MKVAVAESFLAKLRFEDIVRRYEDSRARLPLSPLLAAFVCEGRRRQVGRESLRLACIFELGAATFIPSLVAPCWKLTETENSGAAQEDSGAAQEPPNDLLRLSNVLEDLE